MTPRDEPEPTQPHEPTTPADHVELAALVRKSLHRLIGQDPEEYESGRFSIEAEGHEILILATENQFPAIRFGHHILVIPQERRSETIDFANALHGRSSTLGAHWWLGNECFWQQGVLFAEKFDESIFMAHLQAFINVAADRTPEIRARLGGTPDDRAQFPD